MSPSSTTFLFLSIISIALSKGFLGNTNSNQQVASLSSGFIRTFDQSLSPEKFAECLNQDSESFISLIESYFNIEENIYSNPQKPTLVLSTQKQFLQLNTTFGQIKDNLECAYNTPAFQKIIKNNFTNINATSSLDYFLKILGTQSHANLSNQSRIAINNFNNALNQANPNWTYTGVQMANYFLGVDFRPDNGSKSTVLSFFRGLTTFFIESIDDIEQCIMQNNVDQVLHYYDQLYKTIEGTGQDLPEVLIMYLDEWGGADIYKKNLDFWKCANDTQSAKNLIKLRLFDYDFENINTKFFLVKVAQLRPGPFEKYMGQLSASYQQGNMFYSGFILPFAVEDITNEEDFHFRNNKQSMRIFT